MTETDHENPGGAGQEGVCEDARTSKAERAMNVTMTNERTKLMNIRRQLWTRTLAALALASSATLVGGTQFSHPVLAAGCNHILVSIPALKISRATGNPIEASSFTYDAETSVGGNVASGVQVGKATGEQVTFTKYWDLQSPQLFSRLTTKRSVPEVDFDFVDPTGVTVCETINLLSDLKTPSVGVYVTRIARSADPSMAAGTETITLWAPRVLIKDSGSSAVFDFYDQ